MGVSQESHRKRAFGAGGGNVSACKLGGKRPRNPLSANGVREIRGKGSKEKRMVKKNAPGKITRKKRLGREDQQDTTSGSTHSESLYCAERQRKGGRKIVWS